MEGTGGIEPPTRLLDDANGFEARGVPSTTAPNIYLSTPEYVMGSPPSPAKGRGNVISPPASWGGITGIERDSWVMGHRNLLQIKIRPTV